MNLQILNSEILDRWIGEGGSSDALNIKMKEVKRMRAEELCDWLKNQLEDEEDWKDAKEVIMKQRIKGANFLNLDIAEWKADGLKTGVADSLVQIAKSLTGNSTFLV
jgi:hypothetical protein